MAIIFESAHLKPKGFFNALFKKNVSVKLLIDDIEIDTFNIKKSRPYIGYVLYLNDTTNKEIKIVIYLNKKLTFQTNILKDECFQSVVYINEDIEINLSFHLSSNDLFTFLENKALKSKRKHICDKIFRITYNQQSIKTFNSYENQSYIVNGVNTYQCSSEDEQNLVHHYLIEWEFKYTNKGKKFYVNHYKRMTQWNDPYEDIKCNCVNEKIKDFVLPNLISLHNIFGRFFEDGQIHTERGNVINTTSKLFLLDDSQLFKNRMVIVYKDEIGEDYGAIRSDFFNELGIELSKDPRIEFFDGFCDINPLISRSNLKTNDDEEDNIKFYNDLEDVDFFKYLSTVVALAIANSCNLPMNFTLRFYENILQKDYCIRKIQEIDVQKNIMTMLRLAEKGELKSEGLDDFNLQECLTDYFYTNRKTSYDIIRTTFKKHISDNFSGLITSYELSSLLYGNHEITASMLIQSCINKSSKHKTVDLLFQIFQAADMQFLRKFKQFISGTPTISQAEIINKLFVWEIIISDEKDRLITASTCFNRIYLSEYSNIEDLKNKLTYSMENSGGFHLA